VIIIKFDCIKVRDTEDGPFGLNHTDNIRSASELYRSSDHHLLAKLMPTFADRGCRMIGATHRHGHIPDFLDLSHYFFLLHAIVYVFLHNLLNVIVQIANKIGLKKKS
jgi:hypothetical protein